jgi:hypothetical protein
LSVHRKCKDQENTDQAIQKSRKSKTEENDNTPEALEQSIRVLRTIPLSSSTLLSVPSKLLVFLSSTPIIGQVEGKTSKFRTKKSITKLGNMTGSAFP